jgi:hypothetical protein
MHQCGQIEAQFYVRNFPRRESRPDQEESHAVARDAHQAENGDYVTGVELQLDE